MADIRSNIDQQLSKINQTSIKNQPRGNQNQSTFDQNSILDRFEGHVGPCVAPGADLTPKPCFVGPHSLGTQSGPKSTQERAQKQWTWLTFLGSMSEPSWGRFWSDLGSKMEPNLVQHRSRERAWSKGGHVKNICFYNVFWRIRGAQNRSEIALKTMLS